MTLPTGNNSLFAIADEFGLARTSAFPGAFYGKGGAPSSGTLSFGDFSGRSNVTFTPDGGDVSDEQQFTVQATLSCNVAATWTYTLSGSISANRASGTSGTSITFTTTASGGSPGNRQTRSGSASVTGTANGVTRTFNVYLTADGDQPL